LTCVSQQVCFSESIEQPQAHFGTVFLSESIGLERGREHFGDNGRRP